MRDDSKRIIHDQDQVNLLAQKQSHDRLKQSGSMLEKTIVPIKNIGTIQTVKNGGSRPKPKPKRKGGKKKKK